MARKPVALSWEQAADVPLAGLTAYQSIKRVGVRAGETVLVHAAAGEVGSLGVQIAVALGARVIGTAAAHNHVVCVWPRRRDRTHTAGERARPYAPRRQ